MRRWGGLLYLWLLSQLFGFSVTSHVLSHDVVSNDQPVQDIQKRSPILGIWYGPRRSRNQMPTTTTPAPKAIDPEKLKAELRELNLTIRKLQWWEMTLIRKFGERFHDDQSGLTDNPVWQKVRKFFPFNLKIKKKFFVGDAITKRDWNPNESLRGKSQ